jgi:hypothetical protein
LEKIKKLQNTWNCGTQPNEYEEEKTVAVEQGIQNLCPPWVETETASIRKHKMEIHSWILL